MKKLPKLKIILNTWVPPARPAVLWANSNFFREILQSKSWILEPKYDGWRCLIVSDHHGNIEYFSRQRQKIKKLEKFKLPFEIPKNCILDSEWIDKDNLIVIFDLPVFEGKLNQASFSERRERLAQFVPQLGNVRLIQRLQKSTDVVQSSIEQGLEGVVCKTLKDKGYPFGNTRKWLKVKG